MYGAKTEIAALEKDLPVDVIMVPFTAEHRYEPRHPEVLRINPKRQVPVLVHGTVEIFDSTQIFEYFEELKPAPPLWPAPAAARARARLRELWSDEVFFPPVIRLMSLQGRLAEPATVEAIEEIGRRYLELEALLEHGPFLAGEYGYADIAFFMAQLFAARMSAPMTSLTPRLLAWRETVGARPAVNAVLRRFEATLRQMGLAIPEFVARAAIAGHG
jgi:glutathione S-transferase